MHDAGPPVGAARRLKPARRSCAERASERAGLQAGVSVLGSGQLSLTRQGLQERNRLVYATALAHGVPVLVTCGAAAASAEHQRLAEDPAVRDVVVQANADVYRGAYQTIVTHNHRQFFF